MRGAVRCVLLAGTVPQPHQRQLGQRPALPPGGQRTMFPRPMVLLHRSMRPVWRIFQAMGVFSSSFPVTTCMDGANCYVGCHG